VDLKEFPAMITIDEFMTRNPHTLRPSDSLADARRLMMQHEIRHIPIVEADGNVVGIVSQRDVLRAGESSVAQSATIDESAILLEKIMTSPVHVMDERESLRAAAMHIRKTRHGCIPIVTKGKLRGIVTDSDFVTVAIHLLEQADENEEFLGSEFEEETDFDRELP
jgi:CBS domain-containing protein